MSTTKFLIHMGTASTLYSLWGLQFRLDLFWSTEPKFDYTVASTTRPLSDRAHRQNFVQLLNCTHGKCFINVAELAVSQLTNASSIQNQLTKILTKYFSGMYISYHDVHCSISESLSERFIQPWNTHCTLNGNCNIAIYQPILFSFILL